MDSEKIKKRDKLAHDIIILSRNTLLVNFRFLDMALNQFVFRKYEGSLATDGKYFCYDPAHVLNIYKGEENAPVRAFLHMVMHCVFQHMFTNPNINRPCWDLACDIAVEFIISEFEVKSVKTKKDVLQKKIFEELKGSCKKLTAEKIYRHLLGKNMSEMEMARMRGYFYYDDHLLWYMTDEEKMKIVGDGPDGDESDDYSDGWGEGSKKITGGLLLKETWEKIAKRMQLDIEARGKGMGTDPGGFRMNLEEVNRERYDYTKFLKKFAVLGEAMKINDDEFDYVFYTYGLKLYERMPLVEPLEYKEVKAVKEFVIAIDTSGSVAFDTKCLVQKFVQKTYNILKNEESFFSKINLHIIQCDAAVQEHVKITNQQEFDDYIEHMQISGMGGTDFRPVFSLVDELIKNKEFTNLKGMIYFTDGCGTFPSKKPDYETAFVFIEDQYNNLEIPPWAIKLVLPVEDILEEQ